MYTCGCQYSPNPETEIPITTEKVVILFFKKKQQKKQTQAKPVCQSVMQDGKSLH